VYYEDSNIVMSLLQVGLYSKHHKLGVHYDDFHRPVLSDSEVNRNFLNELLTILTRNWNQIV